MGRWVRKGIRAVVASEEGATAIEYGLLAALAALAIVLGVDSLADRINTVFSTIATEVENA